MDIDLLRFFEERVVGPVADLNDKVDAVADDVTKLNQRMDIHEAQAKKRAEERAERAKRWKRAAIGVASVSAPILLSFAANAFTN